MLKNILILTIFIISSIEIDFTSAECCYSVFDCPKAPTPGKRCADCELASYYCGVGSCNVFGCNCDSGCRKGNPELWCWNPVFCKNVSSIQSSSTFIIKNKNDQLNQEKIKELIKKYDSNNDRMLNKQEFQQLIHEIYSGKINIDNEFNKLDENNDNQITIDEIDKDLKF